MRLKMEQPVWLVETSPLLNCLKKIRKNKYPSGLLEKGSSAVFVGQFKTLVSCDSVTYYSIILFQINVLRFVIFIYS